MPVKKTRTCPLCKKEGIIWLSSHLRNIHKMSAEERAPHLKSARDTAVKNGYTVLNSAVKSDALTEFYEKKRSIEVEFQDIEDRIVGLYLEAKPSTRSTMSIREDIQTQLFPLYHMVLKPIETSVYETMVQLNSVLLHSNARRIKTSEENCSVGEHEITDDGLNINE